MKLIGLPSITLFIWKSYVPVWPWPLTYFPQYWVTWPGARAVYIFPKFKFINLIFLLNMRPRNTDFVDPLPNNRHCHADIAIQWKWSNFDPHRNPLNDYDKTLRNWLRPRDEHVTHNLCQSVVVERLAKYVKYKACLFFFFPCSQTRLLKWPVDGFWRTMVRITRCDARKCLFGVHTMADNILEFKFPLQWTDFQIYSLKICILMNHRQQY